MVTPGSPLFSTWALVLVGNWVSQASLLRKFDDCSCGSSDVVGFEKSSILPTREWCSCDVGSCIYSEDFAPTWWQVSG